MSVDNKYKVSAIVSTYASERFIRGCLENLVKQTLANSLEIIVIDSCSPQNEGGIVREFQEKHPNIVYIRTEKREPLYAAWNRGIKIARGQYVTNANTDDRLRLDAHEVMANHLDTQPQTALVYADAIVTNSENATYDTHIRTGCIINPDYLPEIMLDRCYMGPQPMWRRSVHDTIGYFDETYKSAGDYEFWCRISTRFSMYHIKEFLGLYLHNADGIANSNKTLAEIETRRIKTTYKQLLPKPIKAMVVSCFYPGNIHESGIAHISLKSPQNEETLTLRLRTLLTTTAFPYATDVVPKKGETIAPEILKSLRQEGLLHYYPPIEFHYNLSITGEKLPQNKEWLQILTGILRRFPWLKAIAYTQENTYYPFNFFKSGVFVCGYKHDISDNVLSRASEALSKDDPILCVYIATTKPQGIKQFFNILASPIGNVIFIAYSYILSLKSRK